MISTSTSTSTSNNLISGTIASHQRTDPTHSSTTLSESIFPNTGFHQKRLSNPHYTRMSKSIFTPIPEALEAFAKGEFLVVMDDEDRENEGDLIMAAEFMTTEKMAFLVRYSSGYVCVPLSTERADKLELPLLLEKEQQTDRHGTAYTITVDYRNDTTTGISAHDRGLTVKNLADPKNKSVDFMRPGHICPLRAKPGLLRERTGHTEAAVQLCVLTNLQPAGAICELVRDEDGLMMRLDDCANFSKKHGIKLITIKDLVEYMDEQNI